MLALTALASACTTAPSRPVVAPAVVEYSREFQARAADELDALPPACRREATGADCSALRVIMDDAAELRAQVRALKAEEGQGASPGAITQQERGTVPGSSPRDPTLARRRYSGTLLAWLNTLN